MATDLKAFFMENVLADDTVKVVASKRFLDPATKKPIEWELRSVPSEVDERIRKDCTKKVPISGKRGQYTQELDTDEYLGKLCVECTVFPDLNNAELQDKWGVKKPDALLKRMLKPGEYTEYKAKIAEINGFDMSMEERVDEAKN